MTVKENWKSLIVARAYLQSIVYGQVGVETKDEQIAWAKEMAFEAIVEIGKVAVNMRPEPRDNFDHEDLGR